MLHLRNYSTREACCGKPKIAKLRQESSGLREDSHGTRDRKECSQRKVLATQHARQPFIVATSEERELARQPGGKVDRIRKHLTLSDYSAIYAYGDSRGDREMLELGMHSYYKPFR
jgi:hypothetical protein